jgi:hypothetical protein
MQKLERAYLRIASRALDAADAAADAGVQEKCGFLSYHAFESTGGAYCASRGVQYHPASHRQKIERFVHQAKGEQFAASVAQLAIEVSSLRNRLLYPVAYPDGSADVPENRISAAKAKRLAGRVRALTGRVSSVL